VGDIDADPFALQLLRSGDGSAAAAEGSSTTSPGLLLALMMRSSKAWAFGWDSRGVQRPESLWGKCHPKDSGCVYQAVRPNTVSSESAAGLFWET